MIFIHLIYLSVHTPEYFFPVFCGFKFFFCICVNVKNPELKIFFKQDFIF